MTEKTKFFDDNTRKLWDALTGGSNIPAINDLLYSFKIQFNNYAGSTTFNYKNDQIKFQSGNSIGKFPKNGYLLFNDLKSDYNDKINRNVPILGLYDIGKYDINYPNGGKIVVFGDSTCLDSNFNGNKVSYNNLFQSLVQYKKIKHFFEPCMCTETIYIPF